MGYKCEILNTDFPGLTTNPVKSETRQVSITSTSWPMHSSETECFIKSVDLVHNTSPNDSCTDLINARVEFGLLQWWKIWINIEMQLKNIFIFMIMMLILKEGIVNLLIYILW